MINTGCITSNIRVKYPVFIETKVKVSNSTLSSAVWLLSPDDTQEIDIIEAYGSNTDKNRWYSERIHLSHHMFERRPFKDYQPTDDESWFAQNGKIWNQEWVRVGLYWKDPFTLKYYIDGELVRVVKGKDMIDPMNYAENKGIHKEMDIIINAEEQTWRTAQGLTPTKKQLKMEENNTFLVDWIRIYKPVANKSYTTISNKDHIKKFKKNATTVVKKKQTSY
ncbi:family 16 glycosylhydrolase [Aquimarina agarivorans]|uniref:family 16 glycosylhydrolase n=1 Tax=Aquimarina agarivorans TaxID=980584 RepID=UPI0002FECC9B|nr:family 16 glycosylhydrolase [Aquimarina agarivorans]